jgi:hypothetical protein
MSRFLTAVTVAAGLALLPIATVDACSCAGFDPPTSIAGSDVAYIGTIVAAEAADQVDQGRETTLVAFEVQRARHKIETPFVLDAWLGSSASCGLSMAIGETWLVIAHHEDGRPQTNLCSGSRPLDTLDLAMRQQVAAALPVDPVPAPTDELAEMGEGLWHATIPLPVLLAAGAALLILVASLVAFRKARPE